MSKKNKNKVKKSSKSAMTLIQEILGVVGGIVGSIMAIYGFIKTFRDDVSGFGWLLFLGGAIWLYVIWQMSLRLKTYAYVFFALTIVVGIAGWVGWKGQIQAKEDKVIVVIAKFDGPEEEYGLRDEMIEQLRETTKDYDDTEIIAAEELVAVAQGSEYARKLGEKYQADLVVWAWYKPTENPNITIHIENLSAKQISVIQESESYKPKSTLAELELFDVQRQIGSETSTLVAFITGMLKYKSGDYQIAIERFEQILIQKDVSTYIDRFSIYFNLGYMKCALGDYNLCIQNFSKAIEVDPYYAKAYYNRGVGYILLDNYQEALQDFEKSIQIEPSFESAYYAYYNRGSVNIALGEYQRAIQDYDQIIQINPLDVGAYINRGFAYYRLDEYQRAIQEYDKAIQINPQIAEAYNNRGLAYTHLGEYQRAIQDYDQAVQINPQHANAFYNRGLAYQKLSKNAEAESDFAKYKELTGQDAP